METGILNIHDDEHFSNISSPLYDQGILEDSEGLLLDMLHSEFPSYEIAVSRNFDAPDLWGTEQELNGDLAVLPLAVPLDGSFTSLEPHAKEDFQKMLTEWQEHLGSLQSSDADDMDVKDIAEIDMVLPNHVSEHLPDDIFEDDTKPSVSTGKQIPLLKLEQKSSPLSITMKDDFNKLSLDNFMKCEEDIDLGFAVIKDEAIDMLDSATEGVIIDTKVDLDDDCVDVETVSEQIPVLEARDLASLLEQFEATEVINTSSNSKPSVLDNHLYALATQQLTPSMSESQHTAATPSSAPTKGNTSILSHQSIKDSLPREVIDRIKASGRKKAIPVIPAMPSRRPGRGGTRMQDAGAALSRNKLLKIVSGGGGGESVQLDHDYCTVSTNNVEVAPPPRSFYHSDASEYIADKLNNHHGSDEDKTISNGKCHDEEKVYSRLPEYYMVLAPQRIDRNDMKGRKVAVRDDEFWGESNSKKDSGLESGEVSDASEEVIASPSDTVQHSDTKCSPRDQTGKQPNALHSVPPKTSLVPSSGKSCSNILSVNGKAYHIASGSVSSSKLSTETIVMKPGKEMPMISVLKKCQIGSVPNASGKSFLAHSNSVSCESPATIKEEQQGPKKRKLNLEEYRSRLRELDRIRGSRENSCASSPVHSPSCSTSISVGTSMLEDVKSDSKDNPSIASEVSSKPDMSSEESLSVAKGVESVACETTLRPVMHNVEVQTIPDDEVRIGGGAGKHTQQEDEKERRDGCTRDRRKRHYRSRRASSSSSSGSSSSGNSHTSRRRHKSSRSRHRRRLSWCRSSAGHSNGSCGSRSRGVWSRSPSSGSVKSFCSSNSAHSRSRSRSIGAKSCRRSPSGTNRKWHHSSQYDHHGRHHRRSDRNYAGSRGWRRSRSPQHCNWKNMSGDWQLNEREKQRQVEERRVIYVGRIEEGTSKAELRRRFEMFGPIVDISVHFREHGDNYGFVTFAYKVDAYEAVEHGNDDPNQPHYDLCFGGRRAFCKTRYSDLDGMATKNDPLSNPNGYMQGRPVGISRNRSHNENSFDLLLREAKAKLCKRKA
ncbi:uncharacterized protein LOC111870987 isoform X2 [Cryptotermes secundus]|nr:uncharacterized protein LOC111870987 isoform X2 [Cryptotermes secundus]